MSYVIACLYCGETVLNVAAVGDAEAAKLVAHLADYHVAALRASKSFGDLLQNFSVVERPPQ